MHNVLRDIKPILLGDCDSMECATIADPVCGTDDISYQNSCELERSACFMQENIEVKHKGYCDDQPDQQRKTKGGLS